MHLYSWSNKKPLICLFFALFQAFLQKFMLNVNMSNEWYWRGASRQSECSEKHVSGSVAHSQQVADTYRISKFIWKLTFACFPAPPNVQSHYSKDVGFRIRQNLSFAITSFSSQFLVVILHFYKMIVCPLLSYGGQQNALTSFLCDPLQKGFTSIRCSHHTHKPWEFVFKLNYFSFFVLFFQ